MYVLGRMTSELTSCAVYALMVWCHCALNITHYYTISMAIDWVLAHVVSSSVYTVHIL